jgi:hypothetical protein
MKKTQIKRTIAVLLAVLLVTTLLVSMASAKTANKDLPTKSQVLTFVSNYQGQRNFIDIVSKRSERLHPTWTWDVWQDQYKNKVISFYYKVSTKTYGSIYFDSKGNIISTKNLKLKLIKSYLGI